MGKAVVTVRLMPESPDIDLSTMEQEIGSRIDAFAGSGSQKRFALKPVAFGLKALEAMFLMDESLGSTEPLEQALATVNGVQSVDVTDVRRAFG
jgi:elongation factor 1-beta